MITASPVRAVLRALALAAVAAAAACSETAQFHLQPAFITGSADLVDFGPHEVGSETPQTLFLINKGEVALALHDPTGDTLGGVFTVVMTKQSINPGDDASMKVIFTPTEAKDYQTTLTFTNDSVNRPQFEVVLKGSGFPPDPCKGVGCNAPPKTTCISSTTSRHYNPVGTCESGQCSYAQVDEECPQFGCDDASGLCAKDPCIGVSCQNPPNPCFLATGTCSNGACTYTTNDGVACHDSNPCTFNDTCQAGSCRGTAVACTTPPPTSCVGGTLRTYLPAGACDQNGNCGYTAQDTNCAFGCENGTCKNDPCAAGCDDGNPCTTDSCDHTLGCQHRSNDGASCVSGSSACPSGQCVSGQCLARPDITCQATYDTDLCGSVDVAGRCAASGACVVANPPPQNQCQNCNTSSHLCVKCTPFPGFSLELCL